MATYDYNPNRPRPMSRPNMGANGTINYNPVNGFNPVAAPNVAPITQPAPVQAPPSQWQPAGGGPMYAPGPSPQWSPAPVPPMTMPMPPPPVSGQGGPPMGNASRGNWNAAAPGQLLQPGLDIIRLLGLEGIIPYEEPFRINPASAFYQNVPNWFQNGITSNQQFWPQYGAPAMGGAGNLLQVLAALQAMQQPQGQGQLRNPSPLPRQLPPAGTGRQF